VIAESDNVGGLETPKPNAADEMTTFDPPQGQTIWTKLPLEAGADIVVPDAIAPPAVVEINAGVKLG
jgi:hypothetical protein